SANVTSILELGKSGWHRVAFAPVTIGAKQPNVPSPSAWQLKSAAGGGASATAKLAVYVPGATACSTLDIRPAQMGCPFEKAPHVSYFAVYAATLAALHEIVTDADGFTVVSVYSALGRAHSQPQENGTESWMPGIAMASQPLSAFVTTNRSVAAVLVK